MRTHVEGNGEAVRIDDECQQGQVWIAHYDYHDNDTDTAPFDNDAEGYFLDENATNLNNFNSNSAFANGAGARFMRTLIGGLYAA